MASDLKAEAEKVMLAAYHNGAGAIFRWDHSTTPPTLLGRLSYSPEMGVSFALTALLALLKEWGWAIVPREATVEMRGFGQDADFENLGAVWSAMLAAAPSPFPQETADGQ